MRAVAHVFLIGYLAMLLGVGASGVFVAPTELTGFFRLDLRDMLPVDRSTFVNQYRFLKSIEFGAGVFCAVWRHEILRERSFSLMFLVIVFSGVLARAFSVVRDGRPRSLFLVFMTLELVTGVAVAAVTRPF